MKDTIAIIGQILIIACLSATVIAVIRENRTKPKGFWYILVSRMRYIHFIGYWRFIRSRFTHEQLEDHPDNYPYKWLMDNKIYIAYLIYIPATLELIYEMINQIGTGAVYTKSANYFISSPMRSLCILYILVSLANYARYWKRIALNEKRKNGSLIDTRNRVPASSVSK